MPLPVTPQTFKDMVASPGGSICGKFVKIFALPLRIFELYSYLVADDGTLTPEGAALICQFACAGSGGPGPGPGPGPGGTGGLTTPSLSASDGAFLDRVRVTWSTVAGALNYDLYKNTTNDNTTALLLTTTSAGVGTYDDTDVQEGVTYYYWVKARNATAASSFSNGDSGFTALEIPAVTDLIATQGYHSTQVAKRTVNLMWTATNGADRWDIYRGTEDNFAAATLIDSNRTPFFNMGLSTGTGSGNGTGPVPTFIDNSDHLLYLDEPPNHLENYYYWVVGKSASSANLTPESNSALGWAYGDGSTIEPFEDQDIISGTSANVPAGAVRAWLVLFGAGAGGAGGGTTKGGGGGGAGALIYGKYDLPLTPMVQAKFRVVATPTTNTSKQVLQTNGENGSSMVLQYAQNGVDYITLMTANAPSGGVFDFAGSGAGGAGASGSVDAAVTDAVIKDGRAGLPGMGAKGGKSGSLFGAIRKPPVGVLIVPSTTQINDGDATSPAGAGGNGSGVLGELVKAGRGVTGRAIIVYYDA